MKKSLWQWAGVALMLTLLAACIGNKVYYRYDHTPLNLAVGSVAHTVIDDIHELQLLALTAGRRVILSDGHSLCFLLLFPGLKYRK